MELLKEILQAIVLGLVQGLTEFLPVSSSGHLILFKKLFGLDAETFGLNFDIAVHVATLLAVFVVFRKTIWNLIRHPFQKTVLWLIIATIPAALVGVFLDDQVEAVSQSGGFLGICFLFTAGVLLFAEKMSKRAQSNLEMEDLTWWKAGAIGLAQGVAVMPGISRSGSTLSAGLLTGLGTGAALSFSFLMSIPVIGGSLVLGVKDTLENPEHFNVWVILAGMLAAAASGYVAVRFMLNFIRKKGMKVFAIYLVVIGVLVLMDQLFFRQFFDVFLLG
ncbi:MAG: undecaprenyl-diphosphate phosphatase [Clostridia bacterium]|nr:undecaprenyl-diphosphate phosphatase [Clostridia bacterium]